LPADSHASLRDSLLAHVSAADQNAASVIVKQLGLALADLALQMPTWTAFTRDLVAKLGPDHPFALLEILVVLPEEIASRRLRLGANRREEIRAEFRASAGLVNQFLNHCLATAQQKDTGGSGHVKANVLRCLSSWLNVNAIGSDGVESNPLVHYAFDVLAASSSPADAPDLHDDAADALCALLACVEDIPPEQVRASQLGN